MQLLKSNKQFQEIAQKIVETGGRMYLVGGAVRDMMLNKESHDMDFCVTGLSMEDFQALFPNAKVQGKDFPVFIMDGCEFALARKERKIGEKHTDFEILADKSITIEEDLSRRDLTINAMAIDFLTGELVDPFGGLQDLKDKKIRMTSTAYQEDPLRVYRTARFAAKFGFEIEEKTIKTMESMRRELEHLSAERVLAEFRKALLTDSPRIFFDCLRKANILGVHFQEVEKLIGVEQPALYHPEGDAYEHTMQVLNKVAKATPVELIRFCALVHDFGKIATPRENWPHHYGHEEAGVPIIQEFCHRLKMPKVYEKAGVLTSKLHMKAGKYDSLTPSTKIKMFTEIEKSRSLSYEGLEVIASADSKKEIHFAKVARQVMKQGVTPEIKEKCTVNGTFDYEKAKQMVTQERVEALKSLSKL